MRIPYPELKRTLEKILVGIGFESDRAELCARLFADASRDGVHTHGLNRFARFIETIKTGVVDIEAIPKLVHAHGALEQWDGHQGPGNLNAHASMARAISLAREHGVGCVALRNTNHWMRAGNYGWQAADAGVIGICWTNTLPNLPPWGGREPRLGNNPLVIAVPRLNGHVVLDMAMSQFSYGTLEAYRKRDERLPVIGGFDVSGELTNDPLAIEASQRALPIGFWKGSGLALMLDMVAALLSRGTATREITPVLVKETKLSQVFLAFDLPAGDDFAETLANEIIDWVKSATPLGEARVRYPGERTLQTRQQSMELGVQVDQWIWSEVLAIK